MLLLMYIIRHTQSHMPILMTQYIVKSVFSTVKFQINIAQMWVVYDRFVHRMIQTIPVNETTISNINIKRIYEIQAKMLILEVDSLQAEVKLCRPGHAVPLLYLDLNRTPDVMVFG